MSCVTDEESAPSPTSTDPADWLRVPAAAKRLGQSERTLYTACSARRVPFRRLPGTQTIAFAPEDLAAIAKLSYVAPLNVRA